MDVFDLVAKLTLDKSDYEKGLSDAKLEADGLGGKFEAAGSAISSVGGKLTKKFTAPAIAAGGAILGLATKSAKTSDQIDKMSQKIGISREAYQEWDYVLSQNGADISTLQTGMKTLSRAFTDAANGTDSAVKKFDALGISIEDLQGLSQEDIFETVISRLQEMPESAERTSAAVDLLGRSATELAPLLNSSADATKELKDKAHELGMVLDDETIDAGVNFTDSMDTLKRSFGSAATELGGKLSPALVKLSDWITDKGVPAVSSLVDKVSSVIDWFNNLSPAAQGVIGTIAGIVVAVGPMLVIVGKVVSFGGKIINTVQTIQAMIPGLTAVLSGISPAMIGIVAGIAAVIAIGVLLYKNWDEIKAAAESLKEKISTVIENIKTKFGEMNTKVTEVATGIIDKFKNLPSQMLTIGGNLITGLWNGISGKAQWLIDKVGGFASSVIDKVKSVFGVHSPSRVFDWIGQMLPAGLERGWDKKIGSVQRNIADSLTFGSSITPSAATVRSDTTLNNSITVTLEGDAARLFKVVRKENDIYKKSTGRSAFA